MNMHKEKVILRKLLPQKQGSFCNFCPLDNVLQRDLAQKVSQVFDELGGGKLLKSSKDVYLKPNGVGSNPYVYTRPEFLETVIRYWQANGAKRVFIMENSTQATYTRLVFEQIGYANICKQTGATPIFLDEQPVKEFSFPGPDKVAANYLVRTAGLDCAGTYELDHFGMPQVVVEKLIKAKADNLYINLPKLKTHSMTGVTLGIKNQWGFTRHQDRCKDHNYHLHNKLVDVLSYVQPDVTLIEGIEGTIYGHYFPLAFADHCVRPFRILIGGTNVLATDLVGAGVFGLEVKDVPHLELALKRGLGSGLQGTENIMLTGDVHEWSALDLLGEFAAYGGHYPTDLYPRWPAGVDIVKGQDLACKEGCVNNSLSVLQILAFDHQGRGGWTLLMGRGFSEKVLTNIKGPVFVVGPCAWKEVGALLVQRLGKDQVYVSHECNDLQALVEGMCHLMRVSPIKLGPKTNIFTLIKALLLAKIHGSQGRLVNPLANWRKLR